MLQSQPRGPLRFVTLFAPLFFLAIASASSLVNVTVDDSFGNPQENLQIAYQPAGAWSPGEDCTSCAAHLDTTQVHNGTWHDTTYLADNPPSSPLTATLAFDGVAIYVYCIVTRASTNPFGNSDMTFYLDDVEVGRFLLPPNGDPTYRYSYPVYANASIPSGQHTFMLVNGRSDGQTALALLDYIVFSRDGSHSSSISGTPPSTSSAAPAPLTPSTATAPDITSSTVQASANASSAAATPSDWSHSPSPKPTAATTGIITSSVLVGIVAVAAAVVIYCIRRRKRRARREQGWTVDSESHGGGNSTKGGLPDGAHLARLPYESESASASSPLSLIPVPYLVSRSLGSPDYQWRKGASAPVPMQSQESIGSVGTMAQGSSSRLVSNGTPSFETPPGITYPAADASSEPVPREGPWATADGVLKRPRARGEDGRGGRGVRLGDDGGSGSSRRREEDETAGLGQPVRAFAVSESRGEGSEVGEELEGPPSYAAAVTARPYVPASS